jgi:Holliday junction resolvase-like predicted endonuclease
MADLEAKGYHVSRSAASKGQFDVIAISEAEILLIQVKRTKNKARRFAPKYINQLAAVPVPKSPIIRKQLWCWLDRHGWEVRDV